ncbi:GerAB/ArcD/ProY family transporter [Paenibacillus humicola]|uniref:GerAB/ArcD/ProY family transporter n=1 Tax=Paenibacillus humicola TaxID=3110540 RepID=UPI00237BB93B|nr:GerAB/ArcD/ProY family transporter [Paenibacillus humicola]
MSADKQTINGVQLFSMMMLFIFGTALVIPVGFQSGQEVWLSILLALPAGLLLFLVFVYLYRAYPRLILSGYLRKILGAPIGLPLAVLYAIYFMYVSARNLREAGDLLITSAYDVTPNFVIQTVMILAVIYVLRKGLEVFYRLGQVYFFIIVSIGVIGNMLFIFSGLIDLKNLLPLTGEGGWKQTLSSAYPSIFMFPFGETVCFMTVFTHLKAKNEARNYGLTAMLLSGIALSLTHAMEISVLGPDIYSRSIFPLLSALRLVNIMNFIQRMDALVILALIIGVFFKMTMYAYASMALAADVFNVKEVNKLAYPVSIVILFASMMSAWSFPEHNEEGLTDVKLLKPIFCLMIPCVLMIVHVLRKRLSKARARA